MSIKACQRERAHMPLGWAVFLYSIAFFLLQSCYYDVEEELYPQSSQCNTTAVSYALQVRPILSSNCLGCHAADLNSGGISLEGYDAVKIYAEDGRLACSVGHGTDCVAMPKDRSQLPDCQVLTIQEWVAQGALDN